MSEYDTKRMKIENALDEIGIGHDIKDRLKGAMIELLKITAGITEKSINQLHYDLLANVPEGITSQGLPKRQGYLAARSGIISAISSMLQYDVTEAKCFCADILEDVNDHEEAAILRGKANKEIANSI